MGEAKQKEQVTEEPVVLSIKEQAMAEVKSGVPLPIIAADLGISYSELQKLVS